MAQFIALMRAQEAQGDEDVFWETHPWQRFKRDQKEWIDKKFRSAHKTEVLGGARLSEEEEDALREAKNQEVMDDLEDQVCRRRRERKKREKENKCTLFCLFTYTHTHSHLHTHTHTHTHTQSEESEEEEEEGGDQDDDDDDDEDDK